MARDLSTLAKRLEYARTKANLTQTELAQRAGIGRRSLYRYETGDTTPKQAVAEELAYQLAVEANWLIHGEGQPQKSLADVVAELKDPSGEGITEGALEAIDEVVDVAKRSGPTEQILLLLYRAVDQMQPQSDAQRDRIERIKARIVARTARQSESSE